MKKRTNIAAAVLAALIAAGAAAPLAGCNAADRRASAPTRPPERHTRAALDKIRQAERAVRKDNLDEAVELYREAISLDDRLPVAWNDLGTLLVAQENYLDAVRAFRIAADLDPTDPRPMYNIGTAYGRAGWSEEALEAYEIALMRNPNDLPSLRGAVKAARTLSLADRRTLDRIRLALMIEHDEQWRTFFERERFRVEGKLREQRAREAQAIRG